MSIEILLIVMGMALSPFMQHLWNIFKKLLRRSTWGDAMDGVVSSWKGTIVAIAVIIACFIGIHFAQDAENKANFAVEEQRKVDIITAIDNGNNEIIERLDKLIEVMGADNATAK